MLRRRRLLNSQDDAELGESGFLIGQQLRFVSLLVQLGGILGESSSCLATVLKLLDGAVDLVVL